MIALGGALFLSACNGAASTKPAGATAENEAAAGPSFNCFGSEPFWSLTVDGARLVLQTPERVGDDAEIVTGGWETSSGGTYKWAASDSARSLSIEQKSCTAESGAAFDYEADARQLLGVSNAPGCCTRT